MGQKSTKNSSWEEGEKKNVEFILDKGVCCQNVKFYMAAIHAFT